MATLCLRLHSRLPGSPTVLRHRGCLLAPRGSCPQCPARLILSRAGAFQVPFGPAPAVSPSPILFFPTFPFPSPLPPLVSLRKKKERRKEKKRNQRPAAFGFQTHRSAQYGFPSPTLPNQPHPLPGYLQPTGAPRPRDTADTPRSSAERGPLIPVFPPTCAPAPLTSLPKPTHLPLEFPQTGKERTKKKNQDDFQDPPPSVRAMIMLCAC